MFLFLSQILTIDIFDLAILDPQREFSPDSIKEIIKDKIKGTNSKIKANNIIQNKLRTNVGGRRLKAVLAKYAKNKAKKSVQEKIDTARFQGASYGDPDVVYMPNKKTQYRDRLDKLLESKVKRSTLRKIAALEKLYMSLK